MKKHIEKIKTRIKSTRYGKKFLEEYGFKTAVLAVCSLIINLVFAVMNGVSGIRYSSLWYGSLAAYYIMLIAFRGGVIAVDLNRKRRLTDEGAYLRSQYKIRLGSGAFLVIVQIAMCVSVTQMVLSQRPQSGGQIMAISTAAYTFYKATMAIINIVKAGRRGNPVAQALRELNFADACMSMVSLTVLLITVFDEGEGDEMFLMKALVGFFACALVLAAATFMIVSSVKERCNK